MVENFKEISFEECKEPEDFDKILREKLGIGFTECSQALCESLQDRAQEVAEDLPSMAPYGDYGKLSEDPEVITKFLRDEASKPENWKIEFIEVRKANDQLMELIFVNKAVDDGDVLKGFVFIGLSGKIRHAFAQVHA
jgi:hypothetical protein